MRNKWNLIPIVFVFMGIFMVSLGNSRNKQIAEQGHKTGLVNQTYLIDMICVANEIAPENRTRRPNYREYCYDEAEKMTGQKIRRFGLE